jgi:hypothetical protein
VAMANSQIDEVGKAQLSAHLAEYARLSGETHAIFQRQQQQINAVIFLSSGLFAAILAGIHQNPDFLIVYRYVFVIIPIPFLLLASLHLRDDLKISAIDEYIWLVLRPRVIALSNADDLNMWRWLYYSERLNFGRNFPIIVGLFYLSLSLTRYLYPLMAIIVSLIVYSITGSFGQRCSWSLLFYIDVFATCVVFIGGFIVVRMAGRYRKDVKWITR